VNPESNPLAEARLHALQQELQAETEQAALETSTVEVNGAMGRVSRGDALQVQQMALEMKRRREERLLRVQSALRRLRQGTYGVCVRCKAPIDEARLEAFPDAVCCVRCASPT
jgi:DnaK suppressor protein